MAASLILRPAFIMVFIAIHVVNTIENGQEVEGSIQESSYEYRNRRGREETKKLEEKSTLYQKLVNHNAESSRNLVKTRHKHTRWRTVSKTKLYGCILLLLSGDIALNPGPRRAQYPCKLCNYAVNKGQRAICCDTCDGWVHFKCIPGMTVGEYNELSKSDIMWYCSIDCNPNHQAPPSDIFNFSDSYFTLDNEHVSSHTTDNEINVTLSETVDNVNPRRGRTPRYPCTKCYYAVGQKQRAIQCDRCDLWTHIKCIPMTVEEYHNIGQTDEPWYCHTCPTATLLEEEYDGAFRFSDSF